MKAENLQAPEMTEAQQAVASIVSRARAAQRIIANYSQDQIDELVAAVGWAILEPSRNKELAELAVHDTGLGVVQDKIRKNHNKTLGLLRDLYGRKTVGVIHQDAGMGITEIARPVGVVAAITPSTNPGATPANKVINALKAGNAVILAPSPKGLSTCARFVEFVHAQLRLIEAPTNLVQVLPAPITKEATQALMQQADLVVATGSQANIRAASTCGTPAFGVGAGNVVSVVDETASLAEAAQKIAASKPSTTPPAARLKTAWFYSVPSTRKGLPRSPVAGASCFQAKKRPGLRLSCSPRAGSRERLRLNRQPKLLPWLGFPGQRS